MVRVRYASKIELKYGTLVRYGSWWEVRSTQILNVRYRTAILAYEAAAYYLQQKRAPFFAFFHKTRANTQQVLPLQTGLYRYDKWMMEDINNKNFNGS